MEWPNHLPDLFMPFWVQVMWGWGAGIRSKEPESLNHFVEETTFQKHLLGM